MFPIYSIWRSHLVWTEHTLACHKLISSSSACLTGFFNMVSVSFLQGDLDDIIKWEGFRQHVFLRFTYLHCLLLFSLQTYWYMGFWLLLFPWKYLKTNDALEINTLIWLNELILIFMYLPLCLVFLFINVFLLVWFLNGLKDSMFIMDPKEVNVILN